MTSISSATSATTIMTIGTGMATGAAANSVALDTKRYELLQPAPTAMDVDSSSSGLLRTVSGPSGMVPLPAGSWLARQSNIHDAAALQHDGQLQHDDEANDTDEAAVVDTASMHPLAPVGQSVAVGYYHPPCV